MNVASRLEPDIVHLDTALLFAAFRDAATVEERRRLAREMHDGVAQEIASLGYLVDDMMAESGVPRRGCGSRSCVNGSPPWSVRSGCSVRTLLHQRRRDESLGTAIGSLARHLSGGSGVPIQVTLDESTQRLRPDVEAELLRITQERHEQRRPALRGHAHPGPVHGGASHAEITIASDGRGIAVVARTHTAWRSWPSVPVSSRRASPSSAASLAER